MILYFSGTGNSAWAARKIAERTGDEVCDIGRLIREEKVWEGDTETAVFVTPTYAWRLPRPVEDWIARSSFGRAKAWFVMTCGDHIGNAGAFNKALAEKRGLSYMGTGKLVMPENYTAMFETPDPDTAKKIIRDAVPVLERFAELILRREAFPKEREGPTAAIRSGLVNPAFYRFCVTDKRFRVTESCISCGKCEQLCPLGNIRLEDGKPRWLGACTHCMACINYCPMEAIECGAATRKRHHYTCPF